MWKKLATGGVVAAAILGVGTAALASSPASTPSDPSGSLNALTAPTVSGAGGGGQHAKLRGALKDRLGNALHGEFVTKDKSGEFVTHEVYRGDVTAASATSITVKAADGVSMTYTVNGDTLVRVRTGGKGAKGAISDVVVGDSVVVAGTGKPTPTAKQIVDVKK